MKFPLLFLIVVAMAPARDVVPRNTGPEATASPGGPGGVVVDLKGRRLGESPNPIAPRRGLMPGIIRVSHPVLILRKTSLTRSLGTILLLPGGGYRALAVSHEGELVSDFLNKQGYDVAILEYSIGSSRSIRDKALGDARKAWNLLAVEGNRWGLQTTKMGIMGFSAGGHLAARLAHCLGANDAPAFLVLIYPAYLEEHAGPGGLDPAVAPRGKTSSRVFVLIGDKDKPQWIAGAQAYARTCRENGREAQFHLLPGTAHGFGMKPGRTGPASRWEWDLKRFLQGK